MHIWKTIRKLPDRTPVSVDLALEALRPSSPKALLLRLYSGGHLLGECPPTWIERALIEGQAPPPPWMRVQVDAPGLPAETPIDYIEYKAAEYQHERNKGPWHPVPPRNLKVLRPIESMTPYLSDPSTWARLYVLREELLALRVALRLESLRAARRARLVKAPPVVTKTFPAEGEKKTGRKPSQLRLGIAAFYLKKHESGEVAILFPGAISVFMEELRRHVNDPEVYDETKAHLRKVSRQGSKWRVFVHDPEEIDGKPQKSNEKRGGYKQEAVSSILHDLREQYPVE